MVTRRDVARLAGTSEALVSYVLNSGPRPVAPATRKRILKAIDELGYRPNAVARSLKMARTLTIGLVVPDISNPFFAELARSMEEVAFRSRYTILLGNAMDDLDREAGYVRSMIDRQVDGLIVAPAARTALWLGDVEKSGVARLMLDRDLDVPGASHVLVDNEAGAYDATSHLLGHGRERIGCLAGPEGATPTIERIAGWRRALVTAGRDPERELLVRAAFGWFDGYRSGLAMLSEADRPDALFVASDEQAVGVLKAAAELGLSVPGDLAICAFDGMEPSAYTVPGLTTMRQPMELIGRSAVEWILAKIADPKVLPTRIIHGTALVARGSCGCPDKPRNERAGRRR